LLSEIYRFLPVAEEGLVGPNLLDLVGGGAGLLQFSLHFLKKICDLKQFPYGILI
jgi:hypothetical protein